MFSLQRWARTYRDNTYHASVETNNGAEALNKLLKYQYLPRRKSMNLSNMIRAIVEDFIPALHYKYVYQNFKQSDLYRSYNPTVVPSYLQDRPKSTVLHCLHRKASSNKITDSMIKVIHEGIFEVLGKHKFHTVDFGVTSSAPKCTCKDWEAYKIPCKHFFAIFNWFPEWGWEKLPHSYQNSPYLHLDDEAITTYLQHQHNVSAEEAHPLTPSTTSEPNPTEPNPTEPNPTEPNSTELNPTEPNDQFMESKSLCTDFETANRHLGDLPRKVSIKYFN